MEGRKSKKKVFPLISVTAACLACLILFIVLFTRNKTPGKKFNVLIIVSDALRMDALGCYGGPARTPHIDWLASQGTLFSEARTNSPWTSPAAVSMLTGNYASTYQNGIRKTETSVSRNIKTNFSISDSQFLLCEYMGRIGYRTDIQFHNCNASASNNFQGFQVARSILKLNRSMKTQLRRKTGFINRNYFYSILKPILYRILYNGNRNFFNLVWINDPHAPYAPAKNFPLSPGRQQLKLPKPQKYYRNTSSFHSWRTSPPEKNEILYVRYLYLREVESMDERVGYFIRALEKAGKIKDTYIIFTADHGESFGEHTIFDHGTSYYDELMRVPLIISGPGIPKNKKIKIPVATISLMPTLEDLLGISSGIRYQGKSLKHLLEGKIQAAEPVYFTGILKFTRLKRAYTDALLWRNYKLICLKNNLFELFNIRQDPGEKSNIVKKYPEVKKNLLKKIIEIRRQNRRLRTIHLKNLPRNPTVVWDNEKTVRNLKTLGYIR